MIKFHHVDEPQLIYTWTVDSDGVVTIYWEQNGAPCHFTDDYSKNYLEEAVDRGVWVVVE